MDNFLLTVIIPFLNEYEQVLYTLKNIRETAFADVDIILVNDGSRDDYEYEKVAKQFDAVYISHSKRKGVAFSRDEGVQACRTDYFLLLDAHMRFYTTDWICKMREELIKDDKVLLSCATIKLIEKDDKCDILKKNIKCGAYIDFEDYEQLAVCWNSYPSSTDKKIVQVPCVLGAAYATNKNYWQYLKGLYGLRGYGYDEQLISMKVWLSGGRCIWLKDVLTGHLYRDVFPYEVNNVDYIFNKLYIAELFLPMELKRSIFEESQRKYPFLFLDAMNLLISQRKDIDEHKKYYRQIFTREIESLIRYNSILKNKNK